MRRHPVTDVPRHPGVRSYPCVVWHPKRSAAFSSSSSMEYRIFSSCEDEARTGFLTLEFQCKQEKHLLKPRGAIFLYSGSRNPKAVTFNKSIMLRLSP